MRECYSCGTEFNVEFSEDFEDAEVTHCPCCGELLDEEMELDFDL